MKKIWFIVVIVVLSLVMSSVGITGAPAEEEKGSGEKWFFVVGGFNMVWTVVGPFKSETECQDLARWMATHYRRPYENNVSKCWSFSR